MTKVVLDISAEFYAFAKQQAALYGYPDTQDYLSGMLDMLLLKEKLDFEEKGPPRLPTGPSEAEQEFFAALAEDEGGGLRRKDAPDEARAQESGEAGDLDDGIPF